MPMESAAILLSRTAMTARPVRLFTKFSTKNSVTRMSTTPEVKVEILVTPDTPIGPLMIILPPSPQLEILVDQAEMQTGIIQTEVHNVYNVF